MKNIKKWVLVFSIALGLSLLTTSTVWAWGDLGHQTVAEIAERNLSPEAKQGVLEIFGPESPEGFALAATWPDAVRDDKDFDMFKDYHFAEVPTGKSYATMAASEHAEKDALTVINQYPRLVQRKETNRNRKMVALRYIIHVVGDVHQPLHVGNGVDMGANLCEVHWATKDDKIKKLHSVWDTSLVESAAEHFENSYEPKLRFYGYKQFADDIIKNNPLSAAESKKIAEAQPLTWIDESQALRAEAYPDEKSDKAVADHERPYCKIARPETVKDPVTGKNKVTLKFENGKYDASKIPVLSEEFKAKGEKLIQQRILAGGLRLANLLNRVFAGTVPGKTKLEILKSLELKNR